MLLRHAKSCLVTGATITTALGVVLAGAGPALATGSSVATSAFVPAALPADALPGAPVPPSDDKPADAPVTVLQLTDGAGDTTRIAESGLAELPAEVDTDIPVAPGGLGGSGARSALLAGTEPALLDRMLGVTAPTPAEVDPDAVAILSAPVQTDEFLVAGVTWSGGEELPEGTELYLRVLEDDAWSPWMGLEEELSEKDPAAGDEGPASADAQAIGGTSPFLTGGATAVQVQVAAPDPSALPADLQLSLVPSAPSGDERVVDDAQSGTVAEDGVVVDAPAPEDATMSVFEMNERADEGVPQVSSDAQDAPAGTAGAAGGAAGGSLGASAPMPTAFEQLVGAWQASTLPQATEPAAVAQPNIIRRSAWGADEKHMTWTPRSARLVATVVHHTAGTNNYSASQSAGIVRGVYYYHAVTRNWGDIGYNFLFDKYGRIYEGRARSLIAPRGEMIAGAHAGGYNTGTMGLSAMGDYSNVWAPQVIIDNMAKVTAWQFSRAGIEATSRSGIIAPGTNFTARGTNLPRIFGHRDVAGTTRTTCPGPNIASRLSSMRSSVSSMVKSGAGTAVSDTAPAPNPNAAPVWYLNNNFDNASDLQFEFGLTTDQRLVGDWDGNGVDTAAIRRGNAFHLLNSHSGGSADKVLTYGRAGDQVYIGDWDGNGTDTFAVRRGNIFYVQNSLNGGAADYEIAYGRSEDEVLVGDWNGNGTDTFAVRRGSEFHIRNSMTTGVADRVAAYGRATDLAIVGDWNGDKRDTIGVRRGTVYHLRNIISGGNADITVNYGRDSDQHLVGDWDGDGTDTLGLRRLVP